MALSDEERALLLATLDHDDLLKKQSDKKSLSSKDEESLADAERVLFEARQQDRMRVSANLGTAESKGDVLKAGDK